MFISRSSEERRIYKSQDKSVYKQKQWKHVFIMWWSR